MSAYLNQKWDEITFIRLQCTLYNINWKHIAHITYTHINVHIICRYFRRIFFHGIRPVSETLRESLNTNPLPKAPRGYAHSKTHMIVVKIRTYEVASWSDKKELVLQLPRLYVQCKYIFFTWATHTQVWRYNTYASAVNFAFLKKVSASLLEHWTVFFC